MEILKAMRHLRLGSVLAGEKEDPCRGQHDFA